MKRNRIDIGDWLKLLGAVLFLAATIWYGIWYYSQPLSVQIEMRCRNGDSVACLSVPKN